MNARAHVPIGQEHRLLWVGCGWLVAGLVTIVSISGCRPGVPIVDTAPKPAQADGTISGTVRGPEGTTVPESRLVEVVNVDTGERQRATTNGAGGFSFKLRPGKYRVELPLREGETLTRQPGLIVLNRSDVDAHADFVLRTVRLSRPRGPAYRSDDGLGSPIA